MEKPRNREVTIGEEIGFLTPLKILPKTSLGIKVECVCRCGAKVKRDISALRAALNGSKTPACRKCNRKAIRNGSFGDGVRLTLRAIPNDSYPDPDFR